MVRPIFNSIKFGFFCCSNERKRNETSIIVECVEVDCFNTVIYTRLSYS